LAHSEREYLVETLQAHSNNRAATARALGISRTALYKKLQRLGLLATDIADELSSAMPPEAASALVPREALAD
jgi:DNA-binding NtrC family response regulator